LLDSVVENLKVALFEALYQCAVFVCNDNIKVHQVDIDCDGRTLNCIFWRWVIGRRWESGSCVPARSLTEHDGTRQEEDNGPK
jgi:hypothetical protein